MPTKRTVKITRPTPIKKDEPNYHKRKTYKSLS